MPEHDCPPPSPPPGLYPAERGGRANGLAHSSTTFHFTNREAGPFAYAGWTVSRITFSKRTLGASVLGSTALDDRSRSIM